MPDQPLQFEVYEPTMGMSPYQIFRKLERVGSCGAKVECAQLAHCAGFLLSVRDGNAFLFHWRHPARTRINLIVREAMTHGGDGILRTFIKVGEGGPHDARHNAVIKPSELTFPPYYFTPMTDTKLADHHRARTYTKPAGVVVSLTTIPSRIDHLLPTLLSLLTQTVPPDAILLCIPQTSLREPSKPYVIPPWLEHMDMVKIIRSSEDYGPSTKLIPAVQVGAMSSASHQGTPAC